MATTDIRTENFIFKDNSTFLSQTNWSAFFKKALQQGFSDHVGKYNNSTGKYEISQFDGTIAGLHFSSVQSESLDPVTQAEVDCLYCLDFDGLNSVKLVKVTNISQNANAAVGFLANLLNYYGRTLVNVMQYIQIYAPTLNNPIPLAYAIYGHGYFDLTRVIPPYDNYYPVLSEPDSSDTAVATPYCGYLKDAGLIQVYGRHRYNVNIDASYTLGEYRLYPVPAVSMEPAEIYIKNNTSGSITVKLPLSYRDMYFEYMTDANWTESSGFKCYTLGAGNDMFIKLTQAAQDIYTSGGVSYPKSVYEISRGMEDVVYNDVYTKTQADNLFETQAAAALKADASNVYTKTQADNLLAAKADVSDVYSKTAADSKFETQSAATTALAAKADASDTYTKAEVDALIEDIPVISTVYTKSQTDELLAEKADADDVYSKSAADTLLAAKANSSDVYTKAETNALLVDQDVYSKGETDAIFAPKYSPQFTGTPKAPTASPGNNTTQIATTEFVQTGLNTKANTASPTFTGTPKAPTAAYGTNNTQIATTAFVKNALSSSPALGGTPTATTPAITDDSNRIATTAFVQSIHGNSNVPISEFYVDQWSGSDTTGDGTSDNPFATIQKAVDSACYYGVTTIYIKPVHAGDNVYYEAVTISGKTIKLMGTESNLIQIHTPDNVNVKAAINVLDGGNLELCGDFELEGKNVGLQIKNNSSVLYRIRDLTDKLSIRASGTSANVRHDGIEVYYGSKFMTGFGDLGQTFEVDIYTYPANVPSSGIRLACGSIVAAQKVVMDMSDQRQDQVAISNDKSIVMIEQLLGTYGTAYSGTLGFKNIGNVS